MSDKTEKPRSGWPMDAAPKEEEARVVIWATEKGGWITAVRHEGRWWDFPSMTMDLTDYAECWEDVLPDSDWP